MELELLVLCLRDAIRLVPLAIWRLELTGTYPRSYLNFFSHFHTVLRIHLHYRFDGQACSRIKGWLSVPDFDLLWMH
jgi:hypothetical protein